MAIKLVVVGGAREGMVNLNLPTIIGRSNESSLRIPGGQVSRQHCKIDQRDGNLIIHDMGSLNGTFLNDQQIEGEAVISSGDLLRIGPVTFRVVDENGQSLEPPMAIPVEEDEPADSALEGCVETDEGSFINVDQMQDVNIEEGSDIIFDESYESSSDPGGDSDLDMFLKDLD